MQRAVDIRHMTYILATLAVVIFGSWTRIVDASTDESAPTSSQQPCFPFTESELIEHVRSLATQYFSDFRHAETHVLYGARLTTKNRWTSPADMKNEKPHAELTK